MKYKRKLIVFGLFIISAFAARYIMPFQFFQEFVEKAAYIAIGFFAGNVFEHISGIFKRPGGIS